MRRDPRVLYEVQSLQDWPLVCQMWEFKIYWKDYPLTEASLTEDYLSCLNVEMNVHHICFMSFQMIQ